MMTVRDFLGREIRPGQYIVFPGRKSSSMWMNLARVQDVKDDGSVVAHVTNQAKDSIITRTDRCVVVQ